MPLAKFERKTPVSKLQKTVRIATISRIHLLSLSTDEPLLGGTHKMPTYTIFTLPFLLSFLESLP